MSPAHIKIGLLIAAEAVLIIGQADPADLIPDATSSNPLWAITFVIMALGLLLLIVRRLVDGDLISQKTVEAVVQKAVRDTLQDPEVKALMGGPKKGT